MKYNHLSDLNNVLKVVYSYSSIAIEDDKSNTGLYAKDILDIIKDSEIKLSEHKIGYVTLILDKLFNDKYVVKFNTESNVLKYSITFEGYCFCEEGGYVSSVKNLEAEKLYKDSFEKTSQSINKKLMWFTIVIAVGTSIAAIYYGIEIYKYYNNTNITSNSK